MKPVVFAALVSLCVACGGSVDADFEGLWRGITNVSGSGERERCKDTRLGRPAKRIVEEAKEGFDRLEEFKP